MRTEVGAAIKASVAAGNADSAFQAYDRYFTSVKAHDQGLLADLSRSVLAIVSADKGSIARLPAFERSARYGNAAALQALQQMAAANSLMPESIATDTTLASLGDERAVDRLVQRLGEDGLRDQMPIVEALITAKALRAAYAVAALLSDSNPYNRMAAARGLAILGGREHIASLAAALESETEGPVKPAYAIALKSLGSDAGDALLARLEVSPVADVRVQALDAYYAAKSPKWTSLARLLLRSDSEGARLRAATLLGLDDADARRELVRAATSTNVALREVGARLLETAGARDLDLLVKLLRDTSPVVRTYAAGAILAATTGAPAHR
jgi:HEAT repeat protein